MPLSDMSSLNAYLPPEVISIIVVSAETTRYALAQVSKQLRRRVEGLPIHLRRYFTECIEMRSLPLFEMGLSLLTSCTEWLSEIVCKSGWGEALQLLIAVGYKLSSNCYLEAIDSGNVWIIQQLLEAGLKPSLSDVAKCARRGSLQAIRVLIGAADLSNTEYACSWAAAVGRDDALWLLLSMGCPVGRAIDEAIASDSVECLKELDRQGLISDDSIHKMRKRAARNSLVCFQYFTTGVHHVDLPIDTGYIHDAVCNGNIPCVNYLHTVIGAPLIPELLDCAIDKHQKKTLRWLLSMGVVPSEDAMWRAADNGFHYMDILVDAGVQCTTEHLEQALEFCVPIHSVIRKLVGLGVGLTSSMLVTCTGTDDIGTFRLLIELGCPLPNIYRLAKEALEKEAIRIYFEAISLDPAYRVSWIHLSVLMESEAFEMESYKDLVASVIPRLNPPIRHKRTPAGKIEWTMSTETMGYIISKLGWDRFKGIAECLQS